MVAKRLKTEFKSSLRCIRKGKRTRSELSIHQVAVAAAASNVQEHHLVISVSKTRCSQTATLRRVVHHAAKTPLVRAITTPPQCPEATAIPVVVTTAVRAGVGIKEVKVVQIRAVVMI